MTTRTQVLAVVLGTTFTASAMFMMPTDAPVDRLVKNAEAYIKENPKDASGYYVAGRVHYLAWSIKTGMVPVWRLDEEGKAVKPQVVPDAHVHSSDDQARYNEAQRRALKEFKVESARDLKREDRRAFWNRTREIQQQLQKEGWKPKGLDQKQLDHHAASACRRFREAIALDPKNGLYHLGLASVTEQYAERAAKTGLDPNAQIMYDEGGEPLRAKWLEAALASYAKAFELTQAADAKRRHKPLTGIQSLVSHGAATGYKRVAGELEGKGDKDLIAKMDAHLVALKNLPHGPVTPIVFSLTKHDKLSDLIDAKASAAFDLNGSGLPQKYEWVKPGTALLVWDPAGQGRITSGKQLFGSATWWVLPPDGYRAMDLLDDNRDGELTGNEMRGLAAWFDTNANAKSDPGEVRPLADLGIEAIAVKAQSRDGASPMHPAGLRLRDGRELPTYDWVAQPAK
jgi:hypothetical protein